MASTKEAWRVKHCLVAMISSDQHRSAIKYHNTSAWWNPERAAYFNKLNKRYAQLAGISHGISEDNTEEMTALFLAYAGYKACVTDGWSVKTPMRERECYMTKLHMFCTPDRIAAGLQQ